MPLLNDEQLARLKATPAETCIDCQQSIRKNYCRQCDEFYYQGHAENCSEAEHVGHRTYDLVNDEFGFWPHDLKRLVL